MALLEIDRLTVRYGKALALDQLSIEVREGEIVCVLGPNGAGKSTLLKAISGAVPWAGGMSFEGRSLAGLSADKIVGRRICHCPEGRLLFPELTVLKNLELGAYLRNDRTKIARDLAEVYRLFPVLKERDRQDAGTLSGGEQQMVAIGRALMGAPRLLLLDEPSVGIAHRLKLMIFDAISQVREKGISILLVEQDATAALAVSDRAYVLEHGAIAREGRAEEMARDDGIRRVYLGL